MIDDFITRLQNQGIRLTDKQIQQFEDYADILLEYNQKMNLTAIEHRDEVFEKHFYDSILPSLVYPLQGTLCDVGAGAGFPSIPLKIVYPELDVTIIEPLAKRVHFLTELTAKLKIQVTLLNDRAEDVVKKQREFFDVVTARAVAGLPILAELCIPLVKVNGAFIALKGSKAQEEVQQAQFATQLLGCRLKDIYVQPLNETVSRYNVVYIKNKKTPNKYPRAYAQIKKKPLLKE